MKIIVVYKDYNNIFEIKSKGLNFEINSIKKINKKYIYNKKVICNIKDKILL